MADSGYASAFCHYCTVVNSVTVAASELIKEKPKLIFHW
jgi:hypothetical protein